MLERRGGNASRPCVSKGLFQLGLGLHLCGDDSVPVNLIGWHLNVVPGPRGSHKSASEGAAGIEQESVHKPFHSERQSALDPEEGAEDGAGYQSVSAGIAHNRLVVAHSKLVSHLDHQLLS